MRRKHLCKRVTAFILAAMLVMNFSYPMKTDVKAVTDSNTVLPAESAVPSEGCVFLGIPGSYLTDARGVIDKINEIRLEACQEGVISPATNKALTMDDYVPIKWSAGVEQQMRFRASEAGTAMKCLGSGHNRLNGESIWKMNYPDSFQVSSEIIAYSWSTNVTDSVSQWYNEKEDWVNQNTSAVTGHYTAMINPNNTYIGLATFYSTSVYWRNTTVAQLGSGTNLDETPMNAIDNCVQTVEVTDSCLSSLSLSDVTLTRGDRVPLALNAMVNGLNEEVAVLSGAEYSSSDDAVAEVDEQGSVVAQSAGTAVISAKVGDSLTAECTVTVMEKSDTSTSGTVTTENPDTSTSGTVTTENPDTSTSGTVTTETPDTSTSGTVTTETSDASTSGTVTTENPDTSTSGTVTTETPDTSTSGTVTTETPDASTSGTAPTETPDTSTSGTAPTEMMDTSTSETTTAQQQNTSTLKVKKGQKITAKDGTVYRVTASSGQKKTVEYQGKEGTTKSKVTIPKSITIQGTSYQVTSIADNAFKKNPKIKAVTIGKNINKIGKNAFRNCKKLKKITIKSTKLKKGSVGKHAFSGISKKAIVFVPASKKKAYKGLLQKKGLPSSVKVKVK